ncbi:MAG: 6,7-dimethyl-8-ribityllumazine synthase [Bacteroidia bacterium]
MTNTGHDLSNIRYTDGKAHSHDSVAIVVSKWNPEVTEALFQGAVEVLLAAGLAIENIYRVNVPGSYELPMGASMCFNKYEPLDGVICLGCVIQGETRHFDFICQAAANGIMDVSLTYEVPVIFGVLTPNTQQQALDRAGGKLGNKGCEAAVALLEMIDLQRL